MNCTKRQLTLATSRLLVIVLLGLRESHKPKRKSKRVLLYFP